jgi:membrane protein YqaA with SNARE-associated domain
MQTDRGLATGILVAWLIVSTIAVVILLVLRHDPWPSALSAVVGTGVVSFAGWRVGRGTPPPKMPNRRP